jgi:hypothetical protein
LPACPAAVNVSCLLHATIYCNPLCSSCLPYTPIARRLPTAACPLPISPAQPNYPATRPPNLCPDNNSCHQPTHQSAVRHPPPLPNTLIPPCWAAAVRPEFRHCPCHQFQPADAMLALRRLFRLPRLTTCTNTVPFPAHAYRKTRHPHLWFFFPSPLGFFYAFDRLLAAPASAFPSALLSIPSGPCQ